ncbi:MAG: BlaI/MecI/CopY family transcriptional regulator [Gammaproteobacteria bacterium]|jgi:predicted transcriptional regulator|nr:BlaI/MecI/CopY family transcriptional regulator [Gammaproteobacteria bacterium]
MRNKLSLSGWLGRTLNTARLPELGAREFSVLELLWDSDGLTSQQVLQQLAAAKLSLSTVQSTLERLHRKGLLERTKTGRAFVYTAAVTRENMISRLLHEIADNLADGDSAPMVSGFLEYLGEDPSDRRGGVPRQRVRRGRADD